MTAADFLNLCIAALLLAGIYAAMSVGMTIIYGVMKIVNLAHAGFLMMGAYFAFELHRFFDEGHALSTAGEKVGVKGPFLQSVLSRCDTILGDPLMAAVFALPLFFLIGVIVYSLLVRRLPKSNVPTLASLLLMFGLWLVLQGIAYKVWGTEDRSFFTPLTIAHRDFGPISVPILSLIVFGAAVASVVVLEIVMHRTWFGRSVGALIQNPYAAQIFGVDDVKTSRTSFGLGTAFAGFAGALLGYLFSFSPEFGRQFLLRAFVIIVLGGLESISGVALGALVLAVVETFSIQFVESSYQPAISYGLLVVVLLVLPGGIAGLMKKKWKLA